LKKEGAVMRFLIYLLAVLYILSPYDLLPDFIMGAGWIDDLVALGLLYWYYFVYRKKKIENEEIYRRYRRRSAEWNEKRNGHDKFSEAGGAFRENRGIKDPHDVLGIKKGASMDEIKSAHRRLANQYHPDKVLHLGEEFRLLAEKRFKEIQVAYQELMTK